MGRTSSEQRAARFFEYDNRPNQDVYGAITFAVVSLIVAAGGFFGVANRDPKFLYKVSDDHLNPSQNCPANEPGRKLLEPDTPDETLPFKAPYFLQWLAPWAVASVLFSAVMGVLLVHLFRTNARRMINVAVGVMLATWAGYALVFLIAGQMIPMIVALVCLGIYAVAFYFWQDKFPLMAQLLSVTSNGLQQNGKIALVPLVLPVVLGVISIPVLGLSLAAVMNGQVVRNDSVQVLSDGTCQTDDMEPAACCMWQPDAWVLPYLFIAALFWSWLLFLGDQIKTYVISGTIAQWYFSPVGASTSGNISRSLKHAMGPSFGSLCLSSAILTIVNYLRQMAENARDRRQGNIGMLLLSCVAECIYGVLRFLTKFATIRMAIVGDSFFAAASSVTGLLARNFLNTVAVWWLPPMFLNLYVFTLSIGWGVLVGVLNFFGSGTVANGVVMGVIAAIICLFALGFVVGLMMHIVDTVYICYAMELEANICSKPEVFEVYNSLPKRTPAPGDVVENPDGNYAYAAPLPTDTEATPLLDTTVAPTAPAPPSRGSV